MDIHEPTLTWAEVEAGPLAYKQRKEWCGHVTRFVSEDGTAADMIIDRVEDRGDGVWRLWLIDVEDGDVSY